MAGEEQENLSPPAPGLLWLAFESPWAGPGKPYPRCIVQDSELAKRLRKAWPGVKKLVGENELGKRYLEKAAEAGKRLRWIDCAGWMEAARRQTIKPEEV